MDKINDLFESEILKVVEAFPSIYTKDDVVSLLNALRTNTLHTSADILSEANKSSSAITAKQLEEYVDDITLKLTNALDRGGLDLWDSSSAEFSISYDNRIELENLDINTDNIVDELAALLTENFTDFFGELAKSNDEESN